MRAALSDGVPLERVLVLKAWEEYFRGDFRGALIDAATVIEQLVMFVVSHNLNLRGAGKRSRIARFTDETSKRHLVTVMLGLFGIGEASWRESVAGILDRRHALLHGRARYAAANEAREAVEAAESLLKIWEGLQPRRDETTSGDG
jgi:hypothetical protein